MINRDFNSVNHEDAVNLIRAAIERVTDPGATTTGDALYALSELLETIHGRAGNYRKHLADIDGNPAGDRVMAHLDIARMTIEVAASTTAP